MHGLTYYGDQIGFILVGGKNNKPQVDPTLTISMNATISPDANKRYEVPVEMEAIGLMPILIYHWDRRMMLLINGRLY